MPSPNPKHGWRYSRAAQLKTLQSRIETVGSSIGEAVGANLPAAWLCLGADHPERRSAKRRCGQQGKYGDPRVGRGPEDGGRGRQSVQGTRSWSTPGAARSLNRTADRALRADWHWFRATGTSPGHQNVLFLCVSRTSEKRSCNTCGREQSGGKAWPKAATTVATGATSSRGAPWWPRRPSLDFRSSRVRRTSRSRSACQPFSPAVRPWSGRHRATAACRKSTNSMRPAASAAA